MGAQSKDFGAVSQTDLKGCISAVKFILFLIPVNARELRLFATKLAKLLVNDKMSRSLLSNKMSPKH